jgi:signal transduction histidine kinase
MKLIPRSGLDGRAHNLWDTNQRLVHIRWGVGALVIAGAWIANTAVGISLPFTALFRLALVIYVYNTGVWFFFRMMSGRPLTLRFLSRSIIVQILMDWGALLFFLHFTGGITSPALPIFIVHILLITILLPDSPSLLYLCLMIGLVAVSAVLEAVGAIPHYRVLSVLPEILYREPIYIFGQIAFFSAASGVSVLLATSIIRRLKQHERRQEGLLASARAVSSSLQLCEVLEQLAASAAEALEVPSASIRLLDSTGDNLILEAAVGLSDQYRTKGLVQVSQSRLDSQALSGHPVVIEDTAVDDRLQYRSQVLEEGIKSMLVTPIPGSRRVLGVLRVYAHDTVRFNSEDLEYVQAIASQGGLAIENALAHTSLKEEEQTRSTFIRTVTHELRSPVAGAQSLVRVLEAGLAGGRAEDQQTVLKRVSRRLDFLQELINDLLTLASANARFLPEPELTEIKPVLAQVLEQARPLAEEKTILIETGEIKSDWKVWAAEDVLRMIFSNLVGNAVKFTPQGGSVRIAVEADPESVTFQVIDTGIGIPEEEMENLWGEFFRASNARQAGIHGTGLGLAIVKRMVENAHGHIRVESKEGVGTRFTVHLRRTQE